MSARGSERPVRIPVGRVTLAGDLLIPGTPRAVVLFVHGSGSSRFSPRNRHVADVLQQAGLVRGVRHGRENLFELKPEPLDEARRALDRISRQWDEALGRHGVLEPGTFLLQKPFRVGALGRKVREVLDAAEELGR